MIIGVHYSNQHIRVLIPKVPCVFWSSKSQNCRKLLLCTNGGMIHIFILFCLFNYRILNLITSRSTIPNLRCWCFIICEIITFKVDAKNYFSTDIVKFVQSIKVAYWPKLFANILFQKSIKFTTNIQIFAAMPCF